MFFEKITKENIVKIGDFLKNNTYSCEFTPANLLLWSNMFNTEFSMLGDLLCLRYEEANGPIFALLGAVTADSVKYVIDYCLENNIVPKISLNEEQIAVIGDLGQNYDVFESEKSAEYIYSSEALATLSGKKYHSKRNHIAAFSKQYDWTFEELTPENSHEILSISDNWITDNNKTNEASINTDREGIEMLINNFAAFRARGGIVRVDGKAVAFCLGTPISDTVFDVNFEKALPEYKGAYAVINREFAAYLSDFEFINREDDLGLAGLRKAKLSYRPIKILKKYIIMPKFIREQAINLYLTTFAEETKETAESLFNKFFLHNTLLKLQDKKIVSMLFAIDSAIGKTEAAYIYGAATDKAHRNKGYMKELIDYAAKNYDALYLKPASSELFEFYSKLGFVTNFYKNEIKGTAKSNNVNTQKIDNVVDFVRVRNALSPEISVSLCDTALEYISENYIAVTDSLENPQNFALFTIENDTVIINEALSKSGLEPFLEEICCKYNCKSFAGYTVGTDIPCGMLRTNVELPKKMYMGLDID